MIVLRAKLAAVTLDTQDQKEKAGDYVSLGELSNLRRNSIMRNPKNHYS
ncbi:hypothetical protein MITS9504_03393 [Synechococcus sp. MIT S9504]|nr:hypothetical protein MITS9504_03393 [Synechococcus sp. MIT S9504]